MKPRVLLLRPEMGDRKLEPYASAVRDSGGEPVRDWPDEKHRRDSESLQSFLTRYEAVLLPGGTDIAPGRYGESRLATTKDVDPVLDRVQIAAARILLDESIPTLAICRGLQVVVVAVGGRLYQDLPSERPSDVNHNPGGPRDGLVHNVNVMPESLLARACGSTRFKVNSRHHQAVREGPVPDRVGPFHTVARAPDGVIEGLELPGHRFFIAVQWHPENLVKTSVPSAALFRAFLKA